VPLNSASGLIEGHLPPTNTKSYVIYRTTPFSMTWRTCTNVTWFLDFFGGNYNFILLTFAR